MEITGPADRELSEYETELNMPTLTTALDTQSPRVLGLLRIIAGLLYLEEGLAKLVHWPHVAMFDHVEIFSLLGIAGIIDVVGGAFILVGLFTRWVAFLLSGEMAFAYFVIFQPRGLFPIQNGGGEAILFCFIFLYFFFAGGGAFSLDGKLRRTPQTLPKSGSVRPRLP